jgi:hypothetical protein
MKYLIYPTILALTACVTASDVTAIGNGKFMVTGRASGGMNAGKGTPVAIEKASDYCKNIGKSLIVETTENAMGFGTESTNLIFRCE